MPVGESVTPTESREDEILVMDPGRGRMPPAGRRFLPAVVCRWQEYPESFVSLLE